MWREIIGCDFVSTIVMTGAEFIQDLAVAILIAAVAGAIFQRIGLSAVAGYLVAGMALGPGGGLVHFVNDAGNIETLANVGLLFLMFGIGTRFSLPRLGQLGITVVIAACVSVLLVFNATRLAALAAGLSEIQSLFLAAMLAVSSSTVIGKALQHLGITHRKSGQLALGMTTLEDIAAILVLTFLISYAGVGAAPDAPRIIETLGVLGAFVIFLGVTGLLVVPRFLRFVSVRASGEILTLMVAGLLFALAILGREAGYPLALGAFLMGAIVAETPQRAEVARIFEGLRHLFGAIFFVSIGMMTDFRAYGELWQAVLIVSVFAILVRTAACSASLIIFGNSPREAVRAGLILTPAGEFSLIIAQAGVLAAVLPPDFFPLAVGICLVTTLASSLFMRIAGRVGMLVERVEPAVLKNGLAFYNRWLVSVGRIGKQSAFWRVSKRRLLQMGVGVLFVTGLLMLSNPVYVRILSIGGPDLFISHGTITIFWLALALTVLVPLVAIWRNISAMALLFSQMTSRDRDRETIAPFLIENGMKLAGGSALFLWLWSFLPLGTASVWVFLVVATLVVIILLFFRRRIVQIHSKLEVELETLLGREESKALPDWLNGDGEWDLNVSDFRIPDGAVCGGHRIGELELRRRFGCSIVAIDRQGIYIGNPSSEAILYPGDLLLLLGSRQETAAARNALGAVNLLRDEAPRLDEVQTEDVNVPPDSPLLYKSLAELSISAETGVLVAGINRNGQIQVNPGGSERLEPNDKLLIIGSAAQVNVFRNWLEPRKPGLES